MYNIFSLDGLSTWIYVDSDNVYIARALIYIFYKNIKHITYIGNYSSLDDIVVPENFILDGYDNETYNNFKHEYSFNIN